MVSVWSVSLPAEAIRPPATIQTEVADRLTLEVALEHLQPIADQLLDVGLAEPEELDRALKWLAASLHDTTDDGPWARVQRWWQTGTRPRLRQGITLAFWLDVLDAQTRQRGWMTELQVRHWQQQVHEIRKSL